MGFDGSFVRDLANLMKIALCSSEVFPFAKTGGLADVCGSLPVALEKIGVEVSIFMPGYRSVAMSGYPLTQVTGFASRTTIGRNIQVYFIDHEYYFRRNDLYGEGSKDYSDNIERFSFFCDQILRLLKHLKVRPDVIHCHDWQTALIPVYLKFKHKEDSFFDGIKSLMTIHNLAFQGVFPKAKFSELGLDQSLFHSSGLEFYDQVNLLKGGILFSDRVTTVSPQYAREIQTKEFGCGLSDILRKRTEGIRGILNGLNHEIWDPKTDPWIEQKYSRENFNDIKPINKMMLQRQVGFQESDHIPLVGFVGRLSHQKGVDFILEALEDLVAMGIQMIFLGVGDEEYQRKLNFFTQRHPQQVTASFDFNEAMGHQIFAGSDLFFMPSRFEPCGLTQMISLTYGTIPIVFKTGGLADTVKPFGPLNQEGNGFVFTRYTKEDFLRAVADAVSAFHDARQFYRLQMNALSSEFLWEDSARQYQDIYKCM